jgi:nucleoside-diphosphate-sugar epimerase
MPISVVTGAGGFVGSNLVDRLLDEGHTVRGLDNFSTGRRDTLSQARGRDGFTLYERDIVTDDCQAVFDGATYVFHQAAVPSVPRSVDDPVTTTEANCVGTSNVLVDARDAGVESVVVASSSSVYGSSERSPKTETQPVDPESPYALSKFYTERLAMQFDALYDIDTVALRYFNVFGPRQDPASEYAAVIPKFVRTMLAGDRPPIYGDGEQSRDFTYIDNVLAANLAAATGDCHGAVFNVACGERTTINDLVDTINDILGTDIDPRYTDPRPGDVRHSTADISTAREQLGYEPAVSFREGLERVVSHLRQAD